MASSSSIVFLMYHELEIPGRGLCQSEPGYVRYILSIDAFRAQMEWLKQNGWTGLSVSEALDYPAGQNVCITFDDGCETDLIAAAPILKEYGFKATSFVTVGFMGRSGYLTAGQLRELDASAFEIGCHSMTHPYLCDLPEAELKREMIDSKLQLEEILRHPIAHFSCPGGRYDQRTLAVARTAGFVSVANSRFYANTAQTNSYELGRVAMLRNLSLTDFAQTCRGQGLWKKRVKHQTRENVQELIGNRAYDHLRALLLNRKHR